MVVKVVGEGRKAEFRQSSLLEDPDPQQLILAWDAEEKARREAATAKPGKPTSNSGKKGGAKTEAKKKGASASKPDKAEVASKNAAASAKKAVSTKTTTVGSGKSSSKADAKASTPDRSKSRVSKRGVRTRPATTGTGSASITATKVEKGDGRGHPRSTDQGHAAKAANDLAVPLEESKAEGHSLQSTARAQKAGSPAVTNGHAVADGNGSKKNGNGAAYTGDQIQILEGVQHIRQRPGMYIGTTSTAGLLHLVYEAIDNVVDEFNAGYGTQMWVSIDADGRVTVRDEARGIPIDPKEWGGTVLPTATWIFIKPFTGGKFEPGAYKQAGGLHGVGLTVINALSAELQVDIWKDGQHFHQLFREGQALDYTLRPCDPKAHGSQISWMPDPSIFDDDATYDFETLLSRLEATSCLNRGLRIELSYWDDESDQQVSKILYSQHGLADYVKKLVFGDAAPLLRQPISIVRERDETAVEVVLQPDSGYKTRILSFANGVRTPDGGTHETGFKAALTKVVNDYALKLGLIKDRSKESLKPDVIQQGLSAIVSVKVTDPQFQGQTKNRLNNAPVEGIVRSVVIEGLVEWFEANSAQAKEWLKKIHLAQKARNDAQMAEELARTGQKKGGELIDVSLSRKFAACNGNDPGRNELFLVEGDSAGGSAKQARRSEFQAILALKGKPLNVANATLQRILDNEEIRTIISVIGTGTRHLFDIEKLKFHKIILLSDADVDGSHIVCLLLTLFHQEMPGLVENGNVYLGCPPLYSVKFKGKTVWLTDDEARKQFIKQHADAKNLEFKRYKGLGEMNASELRETTMDPSRRVLKRVTLEDSALATRLVNDLMARENAEARRALLARQAKHLAAAGNLDV